MAMETRTDLCNASPSGTVVAKTSKYGDGDWVGFWLHAESLRVILQLLQDWCCLSSSPVTENDKRVVCRAGTLSKFLPPASACSITYLLAAACLTRSSDS